MLEYHPDVRTQLMNVRVGILYGHAIDDDIAFLEIFQSVDTPQQRTLPRATGTAYDDGLAPLYGFADIIQHLMVFVIPEADIFNFNQTRFLCRRFSNRWLSKEPAEQKVKYSRRQRGRVQQTLLPGRPPD